MISFSDDWAAEIAEESTKEEYQTARVRIEDPSQGTSEWDWTTATWTFTGDPVIYPLGDETGQARIIGVRWGVFTGGEAQANASTLKAIRLQLPYQAVGRVRKGFKVFVTSSPGNPTLENLVFTVTSDLQGATSAARTIEMALDGDVEIPSGP